MTRHDHGLLLSPQAVERFLLDSARYLGLGAEGSHRHSKRLRPPVMLAADSPIRTRHASAAQSGLTR